MLETSDIGLWVVCPIDPAYYIEDFRISVYEANSLWCGWACFDYRLQWNSFGQILTLCKQSSWKNIKEPPWRPLLVECYTIRPCDLNCPSYSKQASPSSFIQILKIRKSQNLQFCKKKKTEIIWLINGNFTIISGRFSQTTWQSFTKLRFSVHG